MKRERFVWPPEKWEERIKSQTEISGFLARDMIRNVANYQADAKKDVRLSVQECKACFYFRRGGIAGQAFTTYNCELCGVEKQYHNTAVPHNCGEHEGICVRCTGRMD